MPHGMFKRMKQIIIRMEIKEGYGCEEIEVSLSRNLLSIRAHPWEFDCCKRQE